MFYSVKGMKENIVGIGENAGYKSMDFVVKVEQFSKRE